MTSDPCTPLTAVNSVLKHATCPEIIFFHWVATEFDSVSFKVYIFRKDKVINLISSSVRTALENPLNYARNYLQGEKQLKSTELSSEHQTRHLLPGFLLHK